MRNFMKKQLMELLDTIGEAHEEILSAENDEIITILTSCQDAAIMIGNKIEESEGEGTGTVRLLEGYCEMLYDISCHLSEKNFSLDKMKKKLDKKTLDISNSLQHEISARKEVVFLPYKASMWDSLESVWKAADEDPDSDAYVVPIPYYTLTSAGAPKDVHYEGGEFPEYVPITDYREYSIPERRPDMIYIHNPYDGCNKVTSVFPDYYSSNLKKYTECLVYIPYFLCIDDAVPEHFVVLPGTIHAHKVILQSDKVRNAYIKIFRNYLKSQGIAEKTFGSLEEKFLALGSPKLDKVVSVSREDFTLPDEWKKYIGEGGERRKVILYNTTLQSFFNAPENYFDKVRRTLDIFKADKNVVLWWRPHPLMKDTIEAMYPDEYEEYVKITDNYVQEGWGIYDESTDLYRAITFSDAYYGDMSSVVELYKATGKPIMIQNIDV